jgi:hypothetical protein
MPYRNLCIFTQPYSESHSHYCSANFYDIPLWLCHPS